jgi:hypothetical protein
MGNRSGQHILRAIDDLNERRILAVNRRDKSTGASG